jgi:hypothetical protein
MSESFRIPLLEELQQAVLMGRIAPIKGCHKGIRQHSQRLECCGIKKPKTVK